MVQLARMDADGRGVPETTVTPLSPDLFDFRSWGNGTAVQCLECEFSLWKSWDENFAKRGPGAALALALGRSWCISRNFAVAELF